jgi:hypothetical protein
MTACIDPTAGPVKLWRADPAVRLMDYRLALRFWLDHPDERLSHILFLENSGYSLDELKREAENNPRGKQVEFISMRCNESPPGVDHGYPEMRMLDLGLEKSELASRATYFMKVTGRLTFPKVSRLLDRLPRSYEFAVDSRNNVHFARRPQVFVTTQLMIFSKEFYEKHIRSLWQQMVPKGYSLIENLFWEELTRYRGQPGVILRWPVNVVPAGIAAHWYKDYSAPRQRLINAGRATARVLLPWWWI